MVVPGACCAAAPSQHCCGSALLLPALAQPFRGSPCCSSTCPKSAAKSSHHRLMTGTSSQVRPDSRVKVTCEQSAAAGVAGGRRGREADQQGGQASGHLGTSRQESLAAAPVPLGQPAAAGHTQGQHAAGSPPSLRRSRGSLAPARCGSPRSGCRCSRWKGRPTSTHRGPGRRR